MKHSAKNRNGLSVAHGIDSALESLPRPSIAPGAAQPQHNPIGGGLGLTGRTLSPSPSPTSAAGSRMRMTEPKSGRPTREEVERRAYELYLSRQGQGGSAEEDWLRAEQELSTRF